MIDQLVGRLLLLGPAIMLALVLSSAGIMLIRPWLARHALAPPNIRSSHRQPTPQGGGGPVVLATLGVAWSAIALSPALLHDQISQLLVLTAAAALLAVVGAFDDMHPLPVEMRLAVQCIAVGSLIAMLPGDLRLLPELPGWAERLLLLLAGIWFVNVVNFMDGIDWMTVVEVIPVTGALCVIGVFGGIGEVPAVVAAALLGAIVGFAPFNRPVAKLFLGDVGSLPLGLIVGWLLLELAAKGHIVAAIILPLYNLADATVTLVRRMAAGEPFWHSHRTHFYQRATDGGFTVSEIVSRVFTLNLALAVLAFASVADSTFLVSAATLVAAAALVAWLQVIFARGRGRATRS